MSGSWSVRVRVPSWTRNPTVTANGTTVPIGPFHDAQGFNYTVYWNTTGTGLTRT